MAAGNYEQAGFIRSRARAPGVVGSSAGTAAAAPVPAPSSARPTISRINIDLGTARLETGGGASAPVVVETIGTHVWAAWATDDGALVELKIGDHPFIPFARHYRVEGFPFEKLTVINQAQAGKVLTLVIINDPSGAANVE